MGVRGRDRRLLHFLVRQQSVERRGQRASSQLMGTSSEHGARDSADKRNSDRCHYLSLMQIQWSWTTRVLTLADICERACGPREGGMYVCARVYTVKLIEHDGGEVDYHGDYNFLVTL